jgi:transcriptional regulator with XRE-family HTH domain
MTYGEKIKAMRVAAGLTQQKLGELCGYTGRSAEVAVQCWEHSRQMPRLEIARALAEALKVTLDDVVP